MTLPLTPGMLLDAASLTPAERTVNRLAHKIAHTELELKRVDRYFTGDQPLAFLAPEVRQQVGDRLTELVINWPRVIVNTVNRRVRLEGFRVGTEGATDAALWEIWRRSGMTTWGPLLQTDALVHKIAFLSVWTDEEDGGSRIYPESAHQCAVEYKPGSQEVRAALKRYDDPDAGDHVATLFLPDEAIEYRLPMRTDAGATLLPGARWAESGRTPNPLGVVPVVPIVNNPRLLNLDGESELSDVMPLADAVNKLATDMMVVSEFHAEPRRYATNLQLPSMDDEDSLERVRAQARAYWDALHAGATWLGGEGTTFGQFPEANLDGFVKAIQLLTAQIAAVAGLPPHYLGINTDNPASADAIRSAESTLTERAREKHGLWGPAYCRAVTMAAAIDDGAPYREAAAAMTGLEAVWANPETSSKAQDADYVAKLLPLGVLDVEAAQERANIGPTERAAIAARVEAAKATAATQDVEARMAQARQLQQRDGLTQEAALAAVGLLAAASLQSGTPTGPPVASGASAPSFGPSRDV